MRHRHIWVLLALAGSIAFSQVQPHSVLRRSHSLAPFGPSEVRSLQSTDTVHVLAIMVQFEKDDDVRTSGDGTFQLQPISGIVDPPPHDSAYFQNKIKFVSNYFGKTSNHQVVVVGTVLNQPITLSKMMASYSPPTTGTTFTELAQMVLESWRMADSLNPTFNFSGYDAFVIFHAGVGRDVDLVSMLGFNPTPYDIPSLTFNLNGFKKALGQPAFDGIAVNGGFKIRNTIVLPETEVRIITSGGASDTLDMSMNGLFAASIGSYLGLPDLFNTNTGKSGIGQFGLMDGAGIFAYNGLFPPEPSAWEKIRLGWVTPISLQGVSQTISLPAVGYRPNPAAAWQDTIYKIPINESEYFLVENRNRDPYGADVSKRGQLLTIVENKTTRVMRIATDQTGFAYSDISAITGSVVDVEDFDWALLGRFNVDSSSKYDGGGVLIWHIDESVIRANEATNTINGDPNHRGVNLEEAQGSQDIGQTYDYLSPGAGFEYGSPTDCWYQENPAQVYRNVFDGSSAPNSNSYNGTKSLVTIKNFSPRSYMMTARVEFGDASLKPLPGFPVRVGWSGSENSVQAVGGGIFVSKGDSVFAFNASGAAKTPSSNGLLSVVGGQQLPAISRNGSLLVGVKDSQLVFIRPIDTNNDSVYDAVNVSTSNLHHVISTSPSILSAGVVVGTRDGYVVTVDSATGSIVQTVSVSGVPVLGLASLVASGTQSWYALTTGKIRSVASSYTFSSPVSGSIVADGANVFVVDTLSRSVLVFDSSLALQRSFSFSRYQGAVSAPTVADVDKDGAFDIAFGVGANLLVFNSTGATLDGFPATLGSPMAANAQPLVCDVDGNDRLELIAALQTGAVKIFSTGGKLLTDYSLDVGDGISSSPAVFRVPSSGNVGLSAVTANGSIYAWEMNTTFSLSNAVWVQRYQNSSHSNYASNYGGTTTPLSPEFLPKDRVYNWPNPVYGATTQIRYYVSRNADVTVQIFDIAGSKITELKGRAIGGQDCEMTWNVQSIQSGVYLARVEANAGGASDVAIIKIAVVK